MQINKILRYLLISGIFMVPFIAFIVSSTMFFPFITGKNFTFRIITELLFGGWIILALRDTAYRPKFSWLIVSIATFVGIIALADFFGENPFKSFWSNFERMEGLVALVHFLMYFIVVGAMLNTEKLWNRLFNVSVGASVFLGIYGLVQLAGKAEIHQGGTRLDATLGNATYLAIYMFFHIFITAILLIRWRGHSFVRYIYGAIIFLQIFILYHTATRGAILGFIGGSILATLLIVVFERERVLFRRISTGILVGLLLLVGGFFVLKDTSFVGGSPVLARLASISLEEESNTRFIIWGMALQGVKEHPLLGWGQENFNYVFNKYYDSRLYAQEPWFDRVHDIILDWLIAGGILGLLAYLSIPLFALYYLWWGSKELSVIEKSLFTGMLAGYGFHNLFVFDNLISYIIFFTILAYIHSINNRKFFGDKFRERFTLGESIREVALPVIVVVLTVFSIYLFNTKGIQTSRTLIQGLSPQQEGVEANLAFFEEAVAYNSLGRQEVVEQFVTAAIQIRSSDLGLDIQTKFFERSKEEMEQLIENNPNDARLRLFIASFFNRFGFYDEAIAQLEKAVELTPGKQAVYFELGTAYINKGDTGKAFEVFEHAYNLEQNSKNARFIYVVGAIYAGKIEVADEIMNGVFKKFDEEKVGFSIDDRVVRAYTNIGRIDKVIDLWQKASIRQPENTQYHLSLAAALAQVGEKELAIKEIERAMEIDPNLKEQGESFIQELRAAP